MKLLRHPALLMTVCFAIGIWLIWLRPQYERVAKLDCAFKVKDSCVQLQLSDTPELREKGLSGRDNLSPTTGMLFEYDAPQTICLWMKDMKFPLDMVWLNEDQKIIKIEAGIAPETYPTSFCADNARYVIEVNAGTAATADLRTGQQLDL